VRPNQGIIGPGGSETIQILLVEKDKKALLESFHNLGQAALDNSKDKFLIQSCSVTNEFRDMYYSNSSSSPGNQQNGPGYDALTNLWTSASARGSGVAVSNKKLGVRHSVDPVSAQAEIAVGSEPASSSSAPPAGPSVAALQAMPKEKIMAEMMTLRGKYDELVHFSVNLTAERDILNNNLEQAKRDLSLVKNAATRGVNAATAPSSSGPSLLTMVMVLLLILSSSILALGTGVRMTQQGTLAGLASIPVVGPWIVNGAASTSRPTASVPDGEL
jgi:hypothetical protein